MGASELAGAAIRQPDGADYRIVRYSQGATSMRAGPFLSPGTNTQARVLNAVRLRSKRPDKLFFSNSTGQHDMSEEAMRELTDDQLNFEVRVTFGAGRGAAMQAIRRLRE